MPMLRAIRLLNAVEGGTHSGAQLQTSLEDAGRLAEFKVLLSMRGQSRRMAASGLTITAIVASQIARDAVFKEASTENSIANQAILKNAGAVATVSSDLASLTEIELNAVTWGQWVTSNYYEVNSKTIIQTFAGTANFASIAALIANGVANNQVTASRPAMRALVASPTSTDLMLSSAGMMSDVADNVTAMGIVASDVMTQAADSATAMAAIKASATAMEIVANSQVAVAAVYANGTSKSGYQTSPHFNTNLVATVSSLARLTSTFASLDDILGSAAALSLVNANDDASGALASSSSTLVTLSNHANLSVVVNNPIIMNAIAANNTAVINLATGANFALVAGNAAFMAGFASNGAATTALAGNAVNFAAAIANPVAIGAITGNQAAMTNYITDTAIFATLMGSSGGRDALFRSTVAVDTIGATASAITWLKTTSGRVSENYSTTVPVPTVFGVYRADAPSKMLVLNVRQAGIAAIPTAYTLSNAVAGSVAGVSFNTIGAAALAAEQYPQSHVASYENVKVLSAPAVIAITGVIGLRYVDMT